MLRRINVLARRLSIQRKLTILIMGVTGSTLVVGGVAVIAIETRLARDALMHNADTVGGVVASALGAAVAFDDDAEATRMVRSLASRPEFLRATVIDIEGRVRAEHRSPTDLETGPARTPLPGATSIQVDRILSSHAIVVDSQPIGWLCIELSRADERQRRSNGILVLVGALAALTLLTGVVAALLQRVISRPILDLAGVMHRMTVEKDFSLRATVQSEDEVGRLVVGFNEMLERIEEQEIALIRHRDRLEDEVGRRTEQLVGLNQVLVREKDRAEAGTRAKSEFLATMSHEIRTPLNGILGMTEVAFDRTVDPEVRECLDTIRISANSLAQVIDDVLDFSKIEAGRMELHRRPFDVAEVVAEGAKPLAVRAHQKGVELVLHADPGLPMRIMGDPDRVRQIVTNLVGNAIKFTTEGVVAIDVRSHSDTSGEVLTIEVTDTGIGIDSDRTAAIFEAFTQADGSITRRFGGTGLGLSISSRLARLMEGSLGVASTLGVGSTFRLTVPLEVVDAKTVRRRAEGRVLVIEPNDAARKAIVSMCRGLGLVAEGVARTDEADRALRTHRSVGEVTQFVFVAAAVDERSGLAYLRKVQQEEPSLLAASLLITTLERGAASDEVQTIVKPVTLAQIEAVVNSAPRPAALHSPAEAASSASGGGDRLRILLVEDNPVNQKVAFALLSQAGHDVIVAADGSESLRILEEHRFDLVFMDMSMPLMSGIEATALIREREREADHQHWIVALTANALAGDRERCLSAGMDDYVSKPFRKVDLLAAVERSKTRAPAPS